MISDVTNAPQAAQNGESKNAAFATLDKDAFLQLLVAQLRYQNPLSPKDGQEYLAQAAQFATVERLDNVEKAQTEAVAYQQILLSTSMIGKRVAGTPDGEDAQIIGTVSSVYFDEGKPNLVVDGRILPVVNVEHVS